MVRMTPYNPEGGLAMSATPGQKRKWAQLLQQKDLSSEQLQQLLSSGLLGQLLELCKHGGLEFYRLDHLRAVLNHGALLYSRGPADIVVDVDYTLTREQMLQQAGYRPGDPHEYPRKIPIGEYTVNTAQINEQTMPRERAGVERVGLGFTSFKRPVNGSKALEALRRCPGIIRETRIGNLSELIALTKLHPDVQRTVPVVALGTIHGSATNPAAKVCMASYNSSWADRSGAPEMVYTDLHREFPENTLFLTSLPVES